MVSRRGAREVAPPSATRPAPLRPGGTARLWTWTCSPARIGLSRHRSCGRVCGCRRRRRCRRGRPCAWPALPFGRRGARSSPHESDIACRERLHRDSDVVDGLVKDEEQGRLGRREIGGDARSRSTVVPGFGCISHRKTERTSATFTRSARLSTGPIREPIALSRLLTTHRFPKMLDNRNATTFFRFGVGGGVGGLVFAFWPLYRR